MLKNVLAKNGHTHMLRIVGTLENMIKEVCGNKSALLILSIYYLKKITKI